MGGWVFESNHPVGLFSRDYVMHVCVTYTQLHTLEVKAIADVAMARMFCEEYVMSGSGLILGLAVLDS